MTAQEYIISTLHALAEPIQVEDIGNTPLKDAIYAKVMSKKFRKLKADDDAVAVTKKAIDLAIQANRPIIINIVFGGNKLWRFEEAPEIDWAELFSLIYFVRWMKSIASVYEPGAHLEYYSEDVAVKGLNNVPKEDTERYSETFRSMLDWVTPFLPEHVTVTYKRYGDEYKDYSDYLKELEDAKILVLNENNGELPTLTETQKIATELNVKLLPGQADDPLWREKVELVHQSLERTKTVERYFNDPIYIPACPTLYPGLIAVGSTKRSYAKFWAAVGVLEADHETYNELVLTPRQLEKAQFDWEDVEIDGLEGKNFSKIRIVKN